MVQGIGRSTFGENEQVPIDTFMVNLKKILLHRTNHYCTDIDIQKLAALVEKKPSASKGNGNAAKLLHTVDDEE